LVTLRSRALRLEARSAAAQAEAQRRLITAAGTDEPLPTDQQADVRRARSQAENLRQQVARLEALHARGATDDQTLDDARARLASADATLEAAERAASASLARWEALRANAALLQQRARDAVLRAPFAGAVVARPVEVGEHVGATTTVVELVDASSLRVEVEVPERHAPAVRPGQRARIEVDGYATSLEGEVRFVAAALDPEERTLTVEVLADNPEGAVRAGHFARVSIETGGVTSRWRVPREALRERAGVERLYVVEGDTARAVLVERAGEDGDHALVSGALSAELRVIHPVPASLADGAPVAPTR
ncbi:MAG TPA: efflux RND transporter periplasmic adaptor subunit, partial [Polyangiaceae bacterium LLY-WYZ-15_(1-7)]|nr:efflux RND transporter periplasmic adaptor subunit [Polyangiaceae bacterium LLY-WYZ-15_(1-7)]